MKEGEQMKKKLKAAGMTFLDSIKVVLIIIACFVALYFGLYLAIYIMYFVHEGILRIFNLDCENPGDSTLATLIEFLFFIILFVAGALIKLRYYTNLEKIEEKEVFEKNKTAELGKGE